MGVFVECFAEMLLPIEAAITARTPQDFYNAIHAAKGAAAQAAAGPLGQLLTNMQSDAFSENWDEHSNNLKLVTAEFNKVNAYFDAHPLNR